MTMTVSGPRESLAYDDATVWVEVEGGFWAGSRAGEFLGTIESQGEHYLAYDSTRLPLGAFPDFGAARDTILGGR